MADLKFLKGTEVAYQELAVKETGTFYLTEENLYLGEIKLSNKQDITDALANYTETELNKLIGSLNDLQTNAKDNVVAAINEVKAAIDTLKTTSKVTLDTLETPAENMAKTYEIKQGGTSVGKIDIPKDMVVSEGSVVVNPEEKIDEPGTYIKLVLNNGNILWINVGKLVDIYTVAEDDTPIQLTIQDNKIKADIKSGRITKEMFDESALEDQLTADDLNELIKTGTENGNIQVNGQNVPVAGLGSAAYEETTAFDPMGSATTAKQEAIKAAEDMWVWGTFEE